MEVVIRKKDNKKILYEIIKKEENKYLLKGVNYRIQVEVEKDDIIEASIDIINKENERCGAYLLSQNNRIYTKGCLLGTILHIDTDEKYLKKCLDLYRDVGIYAYPMLCKEEKMSSDILMGKIDFKPDVIVITGHDYFYGDDIKDVKNYMNSGYFADSVLSAKEKYPNSTIIAGACQSLFEILIARGASFASSPKRKNIHVYDPAIIAIALCTTSHKQIVDFKKMGKYIDDLESAFGGVETFGKMKAMY